MCVCACVCVCLEVTVWCKVWVVRLVLHHLRLWILLEWSFGFCLWATHCLVNPHPKLPSNPPCCRPFNQINPSLTHLVLSLSIQLHLSHSYLLCNSPCLMSPTLTAPPITWLRNCIKKTAESMRSVCGSLSKKAGSIYELPCMWQGEMSLIAARMERYITSQWPCLAS